MAGSKSIGEAEWKPHSCNVETNPYAVEITNRNEEKNHNKSLLPTKLNGESNENNIECVTGDGRKKFEHIDPSNFEWTYYSDGSKYGKRCIIDDEFIGNKETCDEIKLESVLGTRSKVKDSRGGLPCVSPGDKSYSVPEFSSDFHKEGSTLPAVDFSRSNNVITETFIPLQKLSSKPSVSYLEKEKERKNSDEKDEVKELDKWSPAKPLTAGFSS